MEVMLNFIKITHKHKCRTVKIMLNLQVAKFTHVPQFWWYVSSKFVAM